MACNRDIFTFFLLYEDNFTFASYREVNYDQAGRQLRGVVAVPVRVGQ
jgi:hypothetical protein